MVNADGIRQRKELAMGEHPDVGSECGSAWRPKKIDVKGVAKRKHMEDGARGLGHMSSLVDHGPHDMGRSKDSDGDYDGD